MGNDGNKFASFLVGLRMETIFTMILALGGIIGINILRIADGVNWVIPGLQMFGCGLVYSAIYITFTQNRDTLLDMIRRDAAGMLEDEPSKK